MDTLIFTLILLGVGVTILLITGAIAYMADDEDVAWLVSAMGFAYCLTYLIMEHINIG